MKSVLTHPSSMAYDEYTKVWHHDDYLSFLVDNHPALRDVVKQDVSEDGSITTYNHLVKPELPIPGNLKKVISSEKLEYYEIVKWDADNNRHEFQAIMHQADYIKVNGYFVINEAGDKRIERVTTLDITVKIPIVGKLVANFLAAQMDSSYETEARIRGEFARKFFD